jgi:hypothetical protein
MEIIEIILGIFTIVLTFISYYYAVKNNLQKAAGDAVNSAERNELEGKEKMAIAVEQIYDIVPTVLKPLFTREMIEKIVQEVFDKMQAFAKKQAEKGGGRFAS